MKETRSKVRKKSKQLRDMEKAHDANVYSEGFRHGYDMGIEEGKRIAIRENLK